MAQTQAQIQRQKSHSKAREEGKSSHQVEECDISDLMENIDGVLEEMGLEFAANFKQKPGE